LSGDNFVAEITKPTGVTDKIRSIDVDSQGRIFIGVGNDIYRSVDAGSTWTKVFNQTATINEPYVMFVDSQDNIHAQIWNSSDTSWDFYRSTDNGDIWTKTIADMTGTFWHIMEDTSGTATDGYIYANNYASGKNYVWRTTDFGATWSIWANFSDTATHGLPIPTHLHIVGVDRLGQVWVATGDGNSGRIDRWNTTDWEMLANLTSPSDNNWGVQATAIYFDNDYAYLHPDAYYNTWRIPLQGTFADRKEVFNVGAQGLGKSGNNWVFSAKNVDMSNNLYLFGTEMGMLFGTWDNIHFVKLFETNGTGSVFGISQRSPIYFTESSEDKIYRLNVQTEDLVQLYHAQFNEKRGSVTNAQTYVLEQRIHNGTQMVDLTSVALTDVQASLIGLRREGFYTPYGNSGWEWGNKTGWSESGSPTGTVITEGSPPEGSYCYRVNKSSSDGGVTTLRNSSTTYPIFFRGDTLVCSAYVKANVSVSDGMYFYLTKMNPYQNLKQLDIDVTTEWKRVFMAFTLGQQHDLDNATLRITVGFKAVNATFYFDGFHCEVLDVGIEFWNGTDVDSIS